MIQDSRNLDEGEEKYELDSSGSKCGRVTGFCGSDNEGSGRTEVRNIFSLSERLSASQEGLCSTVLIH
jgi:hypothetical protein